MLAIVISFISLLVVITNFILSIKDRGKKEEEENHQPLIEYQVAEMKKAVEDIAIDIKEVKKMIYSFKETTREIVKDAIDEHVRLYHKG